VMGNKFKGEDYKREKKQLEWEGKGWSGRR
jgi:hypothetical protein